jgi:hypothetical protein
LKRWVDGENRDPETRMPCQADIPLLNQVRNLFRFSWPFFAEQELEDNSDRVKGVSHPGYRIVKKFSRTKKEGLAAGEGLPAPWRGELSAKLTKDETD